ncbi:putative membrane protein [Epsilonproteobacteria bacterium SCGC AD-308-E02]|jgi:putative membrane protein|nr:putative membrane protein [Epsilonproteobacteria bacterium SCGC AD-308-E02]
MLLDSFLSFGLFFITALAAVVLFLFLYALVTPYDDYKLIFKDNNTAAAIGFGGAIAGLSIPLYSALTHSVSYFDFVIWAAVAMLMQLIFAFIMTRTKGKYSVEKLIDEGIVSAGVLMAFISISIGLLNAGSMSY